MKKSSVLLLLLIAAVSVFGQAEAIKRANDIMAKVNKTYKSYKSLKVDFSLNIHSPDSDVDETQEGLLYLQGEKYKLKMSGQEIICDGKYIWTYLEEMEEAQVNTYEPEEDEITPDQIFTIYERDFEAIVTEDRKEKGKTITVVELVPKDKNKPFFKIKMFVDAATSTMVRMKIYDKNGNRYTYSIKKMEKNINLQDSFFTFDVSKYPGVELVDLR